MSEMIDRVARAIAAKQYSSPWDHLMAHQRAHYLYMAKTAIEAMREATPDMISAGEGFNFADVAWENMINAALKNNHLLPGHKETMAGLDALTIRKQEVNGNPFVPGTDLALAYDSGFGAGRSSALSSQESR